MAQLDSAAQPDSVPSAAKEKKHPLELLLFYVGSVALLSIMLVETLSVLGRHSSLPLLGAIEIIQALIIIVACISTVLATLRAAHARVQLIIGRLSVNTRARWSRLSALLCSVFFLGLAAGSLWLAHDEWYSFEESEVLHISFRPLRAIVALFVLVTALLFLVNSVRHRDEKR